jgi:hypothetical protein
MSTNTKPKAVLVEDKGWLDKYAYRIADFRKTASLKDKTGYVKGLGSYALYGIDHRLGQLVVLASEPTSADFAQYVTAKAKADACARYDHVVEYRDTGSNSRPNVTIRVWEAAAR